MGDHVNPPKTEEYYQIQKGLPDRFNVPSLVKGYESKPQHPMYKTTNNEYGSRGPSVHEAPIQFHPKDGKFTRALGESGMYRNCGLNTAMDQSKV